MCLSVTITNGEISLELAPTDGKKKQFTQNIKMIYFVQSWHSAASTSSSFILP